MEAKRLLTTFVTILIRLVASHRAILVRRSADPELVHCFVERELIVFELRSASGEPPAAAEDVEAVIGRIRNHQLLWLKDVDRWNDLCAANQRMTLRPA